jgi:hypothetical protein
MAGSSCLLVRPVLSRVGGVVKRQHEQIKEEKLTLIRLGRLVHHLAVAVEAPVNLVQVDGLENVEVERGRDFAVRSPLAVQHRAAFGPASQPTIAEYCRATGDRNLSDARRDKGRSEEHRDQKPGSCSTYHELRFVIHHLALAVSAIFSHSDNNWKISLHVASNVPPRQS